MKNIATELIHQESIGNVNECRRVGAMVSPLLKELYKSGKCMGYTVDVIKDAEQADFHFLEGYSTITNSVYPFLYVVVQPNKDDLHFDEHISFLDESFKEIPKQ